jgi:hypothetical protein
LLLAAIHCASICSGVMVAAVGAFGSAPLTGTCAAAHTEAAIAVAMQTSVDKRLFLIVSGLRGMLNAIK